MTESEEIIIEEINCAFNDVKQVKNNYDVESWCEFTDSWLEENTDKFMYFSHKDELFLLPAFLCYLLRNFRSASQSSMYIKIEGTLREYSKNKGVDSFKFALTNAQFRSIKKFIKHYRDNMPVNIDKDQWDKTLKDWKRE